MVRLEVLDLGILPYTEDVDCRCSLRRYVAQRGIKLSMEGCRTGYEGSDGASGSDRLDEYNGLLGEGTGYYDDE
jgi:hypothetical protein